MPPHHALLWSTRRSPDATGRTAARWATASPLAIRKIRETEWMTVVGVVGDTRVEGLSQDPYAQIYVPLPQMPRSWTYVVLRTGGVIRRGRCGNDPAGGCRGSIPRCRSST